MSIARQTNNYTKQLKDGVYTSQAVAGPAAAGGNMTELFPRGGLESYSKRDELTSAKVQFVQDNAGTGGIPTSPFGMVMASDADFELLQKKKETEAMANLDAWIGTNFHQNDVVKRKWLQEVYPEYYESREQLMLDRAKLALRIKMLLLRGPKNSKDLVLMWGLQTGQIELDRDWDVIGPTSTSGGKTVDLASEQAQFKKGLLSPMYAKDDNRRGRSALNTTNPFRPQGTAAAMQGMAQAQYPKSFIGGYDNGTLPEFFRRL